MTHDWILHAQSFCLLCIALMLWEVGKMLGWDADHEDEE